MSLFKHRHDEGDDFKAKQVQDIIDKQEALNKEMSTTVKQLREAMTDYLEGTP